MNEISLGDAIQKISVSISIELRAVLSMLQNQDEELRTTELRKFVSRSKKRLAQILAIVRWLSMNDVQNYFRSMTDFHNKIFSLETSLARNLDELYFTHASIYAMRSVPYDIIKAYDILSTGKFEGLPGAIFSCGKRILPAEKSREIVIRDLDIYIHSKLLFHDPLPVEFPLTSKIENGVLTVEYPNFFRLFLSLKDLEESSSWKILKCEILTRSNRDRPSLSKEEILNRETQLLQTLLIMQENKEKLENNEITVSLEKQLKLRKIVEICRYIALSTSLTLLQQHIHRPVGSMSNVVGRDLNSITNNDIFYKFSGLFLKNDVFCEFMDYSTVVIKFWKSRFSGLFLFELVISQPRKPTPRDEGLTVDLRTKWTHSLSAASFSTLPGLIENLSNSLEAFDDSKTQEITRSIKNKTSTYKNGEICSVSSDFISVKGEYMEIVEFLKGEKYIEEGVDSDRLCLDMVHVCAVRKLKVLYDRIKAEFFYNPIYNQKFDLFMADSMDSVYLANKKLENSSSNKNTKLDIYVQILVDKSTGSFQLFSKGLGDVLGNFKQIVDLFTTEINNVDSENFLGNCMILSSVTHSVCHDLMTSNTSPKKSFFSKNGSYENGYSKGGLRLSTLSSVLKLFELASTINKIKFNFNETAVPLVLSQLTSEVEQQRTKSLVRAAELTLGYPTGTPSFMYQVGKWDNIASERVQQKEMYRFLMPFSVVGEDKKLGSIGFFGRLEGKEDNSLEDKKEQQTVAQVTLQQTSSNVLKVSKKRKRPTQDNLNNRTNHIEANKIINESYVVLVCVTVQSDFDISFSAVIQKETVSRDVTIEDNTTKMSNLFYEYGKGQSSPQLEIIGITELPVQKALRWAKSVISLPYQFKAGNGNRLHILKSSTNGYSLLQYHEFQFSFSFLRLSTLELNETETYPSRILYFGESLVLSENPSPLVPGHFYIQKDENSDTQENIPSAYLSIEVKFLLSPTTTPSKFFPRCVSIVPQECPLAKVTDPLVSGQRVIFFQTFARELLYHYCDRETEVDEDNAALVELMSEIRPLLDFLWLTICHFTSPLHPIINLKPLEEHNNNKHPVPSEPMDVEPTSDPMEVEPTSEPREILPTAPRTGKPALFSTQNTKVEEGREIIPTVPRVGKPALFSTTVETDFSEGPREIVPSVPRVGKPALFSSTSATDPAASIVTPSIPRIGKPGLGSSLNPAENPVTSIGTKPVLEGSLNLVKPLHIKKDVENNSVSVIFSVLKYSKKGSDDSEKIEFFSKDNLLGVYGYLEAEIKCESVGSKLNNSIIRNGRKLKIHDIVPGAFEMEVGLKDLHGQNPFIVLDNMISSYIDKLHK